MPEIVIKDSDVELTPVQTPPQKEVETDFGEYEFEGSKYKLDKDGNALDNEGKVFKSKQDIDASQIDTSQPIVDKVDIDGVIYTIDKDGNAVDDNNTIKYTKDQIDKMSEEGSSVGLDVSNIIKATAIPIYDNEGNEVTYENSEQGLTNYITDVSQTAYQEGQIAFQNSLLNQFPIIQDVITHLRLYGDLKDFTETPDYSKVTISKDNIAQQEDVVIRARLLRGDTPEKARDYVQYLKDGKRLEEESNSELSYLNNYYNGLKKDKEKTLADQEAANVKQYNEYWGVEVKNGKLHPLNKVGSVYDVVSKGSFQIGEDKYTIPEKIRYTDNGQVRIATRQEFFNYLYEPIQVDTENGPVVMTRDQYKLELERQSRTVGHDLLDALKRFTGYDMNQIIQQTIQERKVNEIRKLKSTGGGQEVNVSTKNKTIDPIVVRRT